MANPENRKINYNYNRRLRLCMSSYPRPASKANDAVNVVACEWGVRFNYN